MSRQLVIASNNRHKIDEIQAILGDQYTLITMNELGYTDEIDETGDTLEANALIKAKALRKITPLPIISDDSGLEVPALQNAPGVYSARYAGPEKNNQNNMNKLLTELSGNNNRTAQFRTVLCLLLDNTTHLFEGVVSGSIVEQPRGKNGFGYDPVFQPDGFSSTFAELQPEVKNNISHRKRAVEKLSMFIQSA